MKLSETSKLHVFWRKCRSCSRSLFFSLPLIFTLHWWPVAILLSSPPLQNFHVVLPTKNCLLCFLSFALDLCRPFLVELRWSAAYTFVFVDYITSSCIWVAIPVELFYIGMPVVRTDGRSVGVRSHDYQTLEDR